MIQRDFHDKLDIDRIISDLKKEETVQYAVSLIHMLGDFSIGRYINYQESIVKRIVVLMTFADMETPYYGPHLKGRGHVHWQEQKVQEKAAQVLAAILGKVNNRHGNHDYDKGSAPILKLPLNLINDLIKFYSIKDNIPTKDPALRAISGFLELAYSSLMVSETDHSYLKPFDSIYKSDAHDKQTCRESIIMPLIYIGKIKLLLQYLDFLSINQLEWHINWFTKTHISRDLTEALEYWVAESRRTVNNRAALQMLEACEVCMLLKSVKAKQDV